MYNNTTNENKSDLVISEISGSDVADYLKQLTCNSNVVTTLHTDRNSDIKVIEKIRNLCNQT